MASTAFSYNGFTFDYPSLVAYSEEAEYSADGVDHLYVKRKARVKGYLNPDLQGGTKPAQTLVNVRDSLLQPRANLVLTHDGVELINQAGQDEKFGPRPLSVQVVEVVGSETLVVEMEIETWDNNCSSNPPDVISNRWSMQIEYAQNQLATRTIEGKLIVRGGKNPDDYRDNLNIGIPTGFVRTGQRFKREQDGISLTYQIVDEEKFFNIPTPLTNWSMDISYSTQIGAKIFVNLTAEATGKKGKTAKEVFQRLVSIMQSTGVLDTQFGIPRDVKWSRSYDKNRWRVSWTCLRKNGTQGLLEDKTLLKAPNVGSKPVDFPIRGTALEKLSAADPKDACNSDKSLTAGGTGSNTTSSSGSGSKVDEGGTLSPVQRSSNALNSSSEHIKNPWLFSTIEARFHTDNHFAILPVANQSARTTIFAQLASATQFLLISFEGERFGKKPKIPDLAPILNKLNATLLDMKIDTGSPIQLPNGDPLFAFRGVATLGLTTPVSAESIPLSPVEDGTGGVTFQVASDDLQNKAFPTV